MRLRDLVQYFFRRAFIIASSSSQPNPVHRLRRSSELHCIVCNILTKLFRPSSSGQALLKMKMKTNTPTQNAECRGRQEGRKEGRTSPTWQEGNRETGSKYRISTLCNCQYRDIQCSVLQTQHFHNHKHLAHAYACTVLKRRLPLLPPGPERS